jgi:hypothetical protein
VVTEKRWAHLATHAARPKPLRDWRTRVDPFEMVWPLSDGGWEKNRIELPRRFLSASKSNSRITTSPRLGSRAVRGEGRPGGRPASGSRTGLDVEGLGDSICASSQPRFMPLGVRWVGGKVGYNSTWEERMRAERMAEM